MIKLSKIYTRIAFSRACVFLSELYFFGNIYFAGNSAFAGTASPFFQEEFPKLSAGDGKLEEKGKDKDQGSLDNPYGPGPSLRPQSTFDVDFWPCFVLISLMNFGLTQNYLILNA